LSEISEVPNVYVYSRILFIFIWLFYDL